MKVDINLREEFLHTVRGDVAYQIRRVNEIDGSPVIVFTHGITADHTLFEKQVEYFAGKYSILTWDLPLHGKSQPYEDYSSEHCAEDLLAILDRESFGKALLVGMSMGGYPCQMFAHLYPERTLGFIGVDTSPFGLSYYSKSDIWLLRYGVFMSNLFTEKYLIQAMVENTSGTDFSQNTMLRILQESGKRRILEQMKIIYGQFVRENCDMVLTCPVVLLLGEQDKTGKVTAYCKAWSEKEGYPLIIVPGAKHFSNGDNPSFVNAEIEKFYLK